MDNFSFVRRNTNDSDISSEFSNSMPMQESKKQQNERRTNQLINKTLKFMDKSKDLIQFTKKIFIPKVKRNLFLQEEQRKKQQRMAHRLLSNGLKGFSNKKNKKFTDQHSIYDDPNEGKSQKRYESLKGRRRRDRYNSQHQKANSLSKIQILTNKQRQQTIADDNYDNEDYIFLNLKKLGESRQISEKVSQQQLVSPLNSKKKGLNLRYHNNKQSNNKKLSISLHIDNPSRPKVKSVDKYDRERLFQMKQTGVKFGDNYRSRNTHSYRKPSQVSIQAANNQKVDSMSALIKLFPIKTMTTPKNQPNSNNNDSIMTGLRSLLGMGNTKINNNRSPSKNSNKGGKVIINQNSFLQQLEQIKSSYQKSKQSTDCLYNLLSVISKQRNKDVIRIYRDEFAKIYAYRYGRDRITSFFDYEYIEDYGSLLQLLTCTVLNFTQNEVMLISFMLLDYDNDGLISHSDLFKLLTLMNDNQLAKKSIFKVIKYVQGYVQRQNVGIRDTCQDEYMRKQNFTLKKYQFMMYMREKRQTSQIVNNNNNSSGNTGGKNSSSILSKVCYGRQSTVMNFQSKSTNGSKMHQMMMGGNNNNSISNNLSSVYKQHFMFKPQKTQNTNNSNNNNDGFNILKALLQSMAKSSQMITNGISFFWINLQRFKTIYSSTVPEIYYDMLYSAFGLQMKGMEYERIDCETPLMKERKVSYMSQQDSLDVLYENLQQMRFTKQDLKIKYLKPDIKQRRRIKIVLQ